MNKLSLKCPFSKSNTFCKFYGINIKFGYQIGNECGLSALDVRFVLQALGPKLQFHLKDGKIVDLENIGKFKVGFKCKADPDPKNLSVKRNIQKYHLNFQPSVVLKLWLKIGITTYKEGSRSI